MPQYMLLLHSKPADDIALSPAELQELIGRYKAWSAQMAQKGKLSGGEKLADDGGRVIRLQGSQVVVSDGILDHFATTAEAVSHVAALVSAAPTARAALEEITAAAARSDATGQDDLTVVAVRRLR